MKRIFTLILTVIIYLLCVISYNQIFEAKTVLCLCECGTVLDVFTTNDDYIYIISNYDNMYKIIKLNDNFTSEEETLNINVNNTAYAYADNIFYFFSKDTDIDENNILPYTIIDSYNFSNKIQRRRIINYAEPDLNGTFAVDQNGYYYLICDNCVNIYSDKFTHYKTILAIDYFKNLIKAPDKNVIYCTENAALTILDNGVEHCFNINADKIYPSTEGLFSGSNGNVYKYSNGAAGIIYEGFTGTHGSAVVGDYLFGNENDVLTAVEIGGEANEYTIAELNNDPFIVSMAGYCVCITQNNNNADIDIFSIEDIDFETTEIESNSDEPIFSTSSQTGTSNNMSSSVYLLNENNHTLTGMQSGTSVASIKSNLKGGSYVIYDSKGYIKTSGNIGTGCVVENVNTGERFTVILYGDLSGEGNINSADSKRMVKYLLGDIELNDAFLISADITNDSVVDLRDYTALDDYLKGNYNIVQKR